jgi:hypothetical protein
MNLPRIRISAWLLWIAMVPGIAIAADNGNSLVVQFPAEVSVVAAELDGAPPAAPITGKISAGSAQFVELDPSVRYDAKLTLADGRILQGVDMSWYNSDPSDPDAGDLNDDDRQQISAIINLPSFFNRIQLLDLPGNHDRAVGLVQFIRDKTFAGDNGQEVIWRVELWYMKNEHGGWVKESSRVLRRQRFDNADQFQKSAGKVIWIAGYGGISVPANATASIPAPAIPSTQPTTQN